MTGFFTLELSTLYFELEVEISEENPPQKTTDSIPLQHCEEIAVPSICRIIFGFFPYAALHFFPALNLTLSDTFSQITKPLKNFA